MDEEIGQNDGKGECSQEKREKTRKGKRESRWRPRQRADLAQNYKTNMSKTRKKTQVPIVLLPAQNLHKQKFNLLNWTKFQLAKNCIIDVW